MKIRVSKAAAKPAVTIVSVDGEVGEEEAAALATQVREQIKMGRSKIVLDLSEVTFLTTRGIAELAAAAKRVRQRGGDLKIAGAKGDVWRVIEMVWLHRMITCYDDAKEAVADF
ncbi:MAG: STAS domain-containing protein [Armatimonadota bacterium]